MYRNRNISNHEGYFQTLVEAMPGGILAVSHDGTILLLNEQAATLFGYNREELIGSAVEILLPERFRQVHVIHRTSFLTSPSTRPMGIGRDLTGRHKNGSEFPLEIGLSHILTDGGPVALAFVTDITERKLTETKIREFAGRAEALANFSKALAAVQLDTQTILRTVAKWASELIGDGSVIALLSDEGLVFEPIVFFHPNPVVEDIMKQIAGEVKEKETTILVSLLRSGKPIHIPVIEPHGAFQQISKHYQSYLKQAGVSSLLIVPLQTSHEVFGILGILRDKPGNPYTNDDLVYLQSLADRAALTIRNARLFEVVNESQKQMRDLARQVADVLEEERKRLSRELHDEAGQSLTALKITLQGLKSDIQSEMSSIHARIEKAINLTDATIQHIHMLSYDLRPPVLDTFGLSAVLEDYCQDFSSRTHISTHFIGVALPPLSSTIEIYLYRIAQEALNNVAKHANAKNVEVELTYQDDNLRLSVKDDGSGFDTNSVLVGKHRKKGIGLLGIQERLALFGGKFDMKSHPGQGTLLRADIPWKSET